MTRRWSRSAADQLLAAALTHAGAAFRSGRAARVPREAHADGVGGAVAVVAVRESIAILVEAIRARRFDRRRRAAVDPARARGLVPVALAVAAHRWRAAVLLAREARLRTRARAVAAAVAPGADGATLPAARRALGIAARERVLAVAIAAAVPVRWLAVLDAPAVRRAGYAVLAVARLADAVAARGRGSRQRGGGGGERLIREVLSPFAGLTFLQAHVAVSSVRETDLESVPHRLA
jgi:hypothetical protein